MKAIGFDLGETLIYYKNIPMNWSTLYRKALNDVALNCNCILNDNDLVNGELILSKYNTRLSPRDEEVSSNKIIGEILSCWGLPVDVYLNNAEKSFFSYFRKEVMIYDDTIPILKYLKRKNIKVGILTDVPYGMSHEFLKLDVDPIAEYIDIVLSSVDVGFRKPNEKGYVDLAKQLNSTVSEMIFVGNEEKDIKGANQAGFFSVLIDRDRSDTRYGENKKISTLVELMRLC